MSNLIKKRRATGKKLCVVLMALLPSFKAFAIEPFVVKDIKVEGLQRVELGTFFTYLPLKVGETVDDIRVPSIIRRIYQSGSFSRVELARDGDVLIVVVQERPVISSLTFDGNSTIKTDDLTKALKLQGIDKGEELNPTTLDRIKQSIVRQYFAYGKYGIRVDIVLNYLPRNRVNVNFKFHEGDAARISAITIVGNKIFSDEELTKRFELTKGGWLSWLKNDNQYSKEKLSGDLEKLKSYYLDKGFLKFNVVSTQVAITPDKKTVFITINIDEGEKYTVTDVSFSGKPILEEDYLLKLVPIKKGDVYSGSIVTYSEENIVKALGYSGYAFANVSTIPSVDDDEHTVALNIFVEPKSRAYVRRILFTGNEKTNDHVLRREMRLTESSALSTDLVDRSKLRLERLPYLEEVNVETKPVEGVDDQVDLFFDVKERPSGTIGGSLGYSQFQGLLLSANISQNNFFGSGKNIGFNASTSKVTTNFSLNYTDPYFTVDEISLSLSGFVSKTDLGALNLVGQSLNSVGVGASYGIPLSEISRFNLGFRASDNSLDTAANSGLAISETIKDFFSDVAQNPFVDPVYDYKMLSVSGTWLQNSLNRGIFPDRGTSQTLSLEATVPVGDLDFYKVEYKIAHYIPITDGWAVLMRGQLSYGDAYGSKNSKLPYFENFNAGGLSSMRGFDTNSIGPQQFFLNPTTGPVIPGSDSSDPSTGVPLGREFDRVSFSRRSTGGNARALAGLELIFPTPFAEGNRSMRTSAFLDVGNVWDTKFDKNKFSYLQADQLELIPDYAKANDYRASVGVSLQWISQLGPLTFSLSKPLSKQPGDRLETFSFNIGTTF